MTLSTSRLQRGWWVLLLLLAAGCQRVDQNIRFTLPEDGIVTLRVTTPVEAQPGTPPTSVPVRELATAQPFKKGSHVVPWDGRDDQGNVVKPAEYHWQGVWHTGLTAKVKGWAGREEPMPRWPQKGGVPSAVCADAERIYLGWSNVEEGTVVAACDLDGKIIWSWQLDGPGGCQALAVDAGVVYVLGGREGSEAEGGNLIKLNSQDGKRLSWEKGEDLPVLSLWPENSAAKPDKADGMGVKSGRIYLTFTALHFIAILDSKTGTYLSTVVGPSPGLIDVVPTRTESVDQPGQLMEADFAVVALQGGVLGKVLFAHDPFWVMMSEMQPLDSEERISALTLIGDGAKQYQHSIFVGLADPLHQLQRRSVIDREGFAWLAGRQGGRPDTGPWQKDGLRNIRGVALDAQGRLWAAERDRWPGRFSVWQTDGTQGKLVKEIFSGFPVKNVGVAVLPTEPGVMVAAGCEWQIDPQTGRAQCTGVIARDGLDWAQFHVSPEGRVELVAGDGDSRKVYERLGPGNYAPSKLGPVLKSRDRVSEVRLDKEQGHARIIQQDDGWVVTSDYGLRLGVLFSGEQKEPGEVLPGADVTRIPASQYGSVSQAADGRVYVGMAGTALWNLEIQGFSSVKRLPGGELAVPKY